jgi:hypothetical protein
MKNSLACVTFNGKKSTMFAIKAVKKSVRICMGQLLMIINIFPLKTLSIVLLYFEIRNSLLSTL